MQKLIATLLVILQLLPFATWGVGPENAYMPVLKEIFKELDRDENKFVKFIVLDCGDVGLADTAKLEKAVQAYCDKRGLKLLPYDFEWLKENGQVKTDPLTYEEDMNWWFVNGVMIDFRDEKLTRNTLVTHADLIFSEYGGRIREYTVKRIGFVWFIVSIVKGII